MARRRRIGVGSARNKKTKTLPMVASEPGSPAFETGVCPIVLEPHLGPSEFPLGFIAWPLSLDFA